MMAPDPTDEWRGVLEFPHIAQCPGVKDRVLLDKLLHGDFRLTDWSSLHYFMFHPRGAHSVDIGNATDHQDCLEAIQTILLVMHGEPWRDFLSPFIARLRKGDQRYWTNPQSTVDEHHFLTYIIQQGFCNLGMIVRRRESRREGYFLSIIEVLVRRHRRD